MKNEQWGYAGQGEGFLASQMRLMIGVNVFTLLLSIGLHWPYQSERYFFSLTHPMTTTIALALVLTVVEPRYFLPSRRVGSPVVGVA